MAADPRTVRACQKHSWSPRSRRSGRTSPPPCPARSARPRTRPTWSATAHVVTWAVGHLVGLAEPDTYDPRFKKWRFADLPIVPDEFKLVPNDEKSKKQLHAIHRLMKDDDIGEVVNACDAGREGELIFAYVYATSSAAKPVRRLWLNSMTKKAIVDAFEQLRPGEEMEPLEAAARSRSEADWLVGHERDPRRLDPAASGLRRRRLAGARPDADARARRAARGGDPRVQARAVLARRGRLRGRRRAPLRGPLPRRQADRRGARRPRSSRSAATSAARSRSSRRRRSASARSSSTTSPRSSGRPTRGSASPPSARWARPRSSTSSTRRSPIRARTRAGSRAT